ncbi:twin-arginine translocase TatA/TatE family subunit [Paracoccus sp. PAMC 22219]|jgi:sec-independent protein translocase protein TatA|uniref:twin-arginine translocase TatA/TatE family subunit n=1 Tax=Paracoccus sp. PAMC 22219 TaxID=1569209 RepID=UPI0005AA0A50|nr:twin-arginine translocase TatA/TatE family subunit [Paracoccus sp. PAMC 22219]
MHAPSPMALLVIAIVVLVLFGRGKVSSLMGEFGKGITAFKKGMNDPAAEQTAEKPATLDTPTQPVAPVHTVPGSDARDVTPHTDTRT